MKNIPAFCIGVSLFCGIVSGCSKEALPILPSSSTGDRVSSEAGATAASGADISKALNPTGGVLGFYSAGGEKITYKGQANSTGSNALVFASWSHPKKALKPTPDKKHLTMLYAYYEELGWAYIIDYNPATKAITLSPNQAMTDGIVPGSFETISATYDATTLSGYFTTRYTGKNDNGNETEIADIFNKIP